MSEPSSGVPGEIADAEVEAPTPDEEPDTLELEIDEEKVEAWDEVKGDYQVEPGGGPVANSMDQTDLTAADDDSVPDAADSVADGAQPTTTPRTTARRATNQPTTGPTTASRTTDPFVRVRPTPDVPLRASSAVRPDRLAASPHRAPGLPLCQRARRASGVI